MAKPIQIMMPQRSTRKKLRTAAYCRVSSKSPEQINSYMNQVDYFTKLIDRNPEWERVEVFADEGISGMKTENRPDFQRMIQMCRKGMIDLIVVKSLSRFGRNTKESLEYVHTLKLLNVGVFFEEENINSLYMDNEMLLSTLAAIAQEDSKAISVRTRNSIVKRMEKGLFVDSNAPYGYHLVDKKLQIYEPEAEVVRTIFKLYLNGRSTAAIARMLDQEAIPTRNGGKSWKANKIAYMLSNERYVGDCLYQKQYSDTSVPFTQHTNRGQADLYYAKNTHPAIVDRETFEKVQTLLKKRNQNFARATAKNEYPLTSRIRCSECGSVYRRKVRSGCIKWVCGKHEDDSSACDSFYYSEERIYDGFNALVNKLRFGPEDILGTLLAKLEQVADYYKRSNKRAMAISTEIANLSKKLVLLEQLRAKKYLAEEAYLSQTAEANQRIRRLKLERAEAYESKIVEMIGNVRMLRDCLKAIQAPQESFDAELFEKIVKDITINKQDEMTITVIGGLKFTELI